MPQLACRVGVGCQATEHRHVQCLLQLLLLTSVRLFTAAMDLLKAEIERKRKLLEAKALVGPDKKFFKREELMKKEEEEYLKKQQEKRGQASDESGDDENQSSQHSRPETSGSDKKKEERILPRKEVLRRLRERNEPITLFGESEPEAFRRLRKLEILEPDTADRGFRNDFQEAMEQVDQDYLNEILKTGGENSNDKTNDVKVDAIKVSGIDEICSMAVNLGKKRDDSGPDCDLILTFLKYILSLWGNQLNSRPEKTSTQSKIGSATYTQTQAYLRPLFKQLKSHKVADDILKHLTIIVRFLLARDYVKAADAYLQMAIGNAPWPIGVTMVGIHARTGREKIFSQNIAHVLNDETQRKYIQALKRLMTQCQKFFPTDPSRCVEYVKED